ncbi:alpha/beta hydrolase family protein [Chryseobacterium polytrichastri]|uniref:Prolyl oligopeptidase family protein n=1 Tax=Chryseobacterium polytrichastri TaxID=1302687 RepID=A0A1M6VTD4_9FLAO|nr:prolyl oligopeptidase family serine peptidase [Chryseobacterium polytrichastri]SHK84783.1 Prolyl oligopeptidase family protein [Chryseobacterium polytrichastri]
MQGIKLQKAKMMFSINYLMLLLGLLCYTSVLGQTDSSFKDNLIKKNQTTTHQDTMQIWKSKFFKVNITDYSPDGRWIAVKKWYDYNADTMMIMDANRSNAVEGYLVKKNQLTFLKANVLLASGNSQTDLWNLITHQRKIFENISKTDALQTVNQFAMLSKDKGLTVYDYHGTLLQSVPNVTNYITDGRQKVYAERRVGEWSEIILIENAKPQQGEKNFNYRNNNNNNNNNTNEKSKEPTVLFSTKNKIERFELGPSGKQVMITEKEETTAKRNLIFISTSAIADQTPLYPLGRDTQDADFFKVTEIQDGEMYCIESQKYVKHKNNVEIWYGNDGALKDMEYGTVKRDYVVWYPKGNSITRIPTDQFESIASFNNTLYFLAFNKAELQNYVSWIPDINMNLFDIKTGTFQQLDAIKPSLYSSKSGNWFIYPDLKNNWVLYNPNTQIKKRIGDFHLKTPVFSFDEKMIYFESENDLWEYHIESESLHSLHMGKNKKTEILNKKETSLIDGFNFFQHRIDNADFLLVKVSDLVNNEVSVVQWDGHTIRTVVSPRIANIKNIKYDADRKKFCFVEESFNMPSQVVEYNIRKGNEHPVFEDRRDQESIGMRQEMIHYKNTEGTPLKGILYYPIGFNHQKKYPMVVRVYQVQSDEATQYLTPGYNNPICFDLRALLKRGYFVLMPDIVFTKTGTGLSALDCVNKALDEVSKNQNIDMDKTALIGHSHGGYETNFIATHSDRFAAYISGAGNSDIIRSYFSYNYNFSSPFYWQFENGQYEMNIPFAENKELYVRNNPIYNVEKVNAPILLWAGKKDENIAWDQGMEFYVGLRRNKKEVIALFYPEKGHDLEPNTEERRDLHRRVLEWLDYFLKDKKEITWINKQIKRGSHE